MHVSSQKVRIIAAVIIATAMIGASFWLTSSSPKLASALSTDELLRAYVEQDTDSDGLPDWQEEVYGTDPGNPSSVEPGLTDLEALKEGFVKPLYESEELPEDSAPPPFVPGKDPAAGSLTERFSTQFAEAYFSQGGYAEGFDTEAMVADMLSFIQTNAENAFSSSYTKVDIRLSSSIDNSEYAYVLYEALRAPDFSEVDSPLPVLSLALVKEGDRDAAPQIRILGDNFRAYVRSLNTMQIPSVFANDHLALIQSYDSLSKIADTIAGYEEDPILALAALSAYQDAAESLAEAIGNIAIVLRGNEEPVPGTPEAHILDFARATAQ